MPTILVVDDEANIRDVVQYALGREGFEVRTAADGEAALAQVGAGGIDLVVLDILMPELDGLTVCRRIRERSRMPIIFLSSRSEEVDRILGLELGGDDYVAKPFSPRELATRVKAVLRRCTPDSPSAAPAKVALATHADAAQPDRGRAEPVASPGEILEHGTIRLDLARHELRVDGKRVDLTVTEFGVLRVLLERPGRVYTRAQLIDRAYAEDYHITERTIDTHIRRIRAKLRPFAVDPIETVHGLGYKAAEASSR